jgi:hypothetical protein
MSSLNEVSILLRCTAFRSIGADNEINNQDILKRNQKVEGIAFI